MTWTRLDDRWSELPVFEEMSFEDRWHYLAMIQRCSRAEAYDGVIRAVDARRCSDHPDPASAIARLVNAQLVEIVAGGKYRIVHIGDHTPPPSVRKKTEADRLRQRRKRAHDNDDHHLCSVEADCRVTATVTRDKERDVRTGQDRPGRSEVPTIKPTNEWPVVPIHRGNVCDVCLMPLPADSVLMICETDDEAHEAARMRTAS